MAVRYTDGPAPAPSQPAPVRLHRIEKGTTCTVRMLSERIGGLNTHYVGKRSRYCEGEECPNTFHRTESVWKGYVAAELWQQHHKHWLPIVLELTEHAELDMRDVYSRGQMWQFAREEERTSKKRPVVASLLNGPTGEQLPPAFDVTRVLVHVYHVPRISLEVKNPLPPRLILAPTPALPFKVKHGGA